MFYEEYKKKSNNKLIEILNSDSHQLTARNTAQKILEERNVEYQITDEKPILNKLNCFQLFEKLADYGLNIYTSKRKRHIEVKQHNNGLEIGLVFFTLSFILLILTFVILFSPQNYDNISAGSRAASLRWHWTSTVGFFAVGLLNYQRDKKSKVRLLFNENKLKIKQRKIWKKESFDLNLLGTDIEFKKIKKRYFAFIKLKNREIDLFDFKDNNIGNKTEDLLSILIENLNKEKKLATH